MAQNFLQLNWNKTEILLIGSESSNTQIRIILGSYSNFITSLCRNIGILFDSNLTLTSHIKSITQSCFFQLRKISKIKQFLSIKNLKTVIHAFISSRLDYCNSLFSVCSKKSVHPSTNPNHLQGRWPYGLSSPSWCLSASHMNRLCKTISAVCFICKGKSCFCLIVQVFHRSVHLYFQILVLFLHKVSF